MASGGGRGLRFPLALVGLPASARAGSKKRSCSLGDVLVELGLAARESTGLCATSSAYTDVRARRSSIVMSDRTLDRTLAPSEPSAVGGVLLRLGFEAKGEWLLNECVGEMRSETGRDGGLNVSAGDQADGDGVERSEASGMTLGGAGKYENRKFAMDDGAVDALSERCSDVARQVACDDVEERPVAAGGLGGADWDSAWDMATAAGVLWAL